MPKIVCIHSFRGGTGKSNTTANVAALLARRGLRVGVIDTDIQSPGVHILFGIGEAEMDYSLNDYLWGRCDIRQAALDVTERLGPSNSGALFLIPSSLKAGEITRVLREGYDVGLLNDGFHSLLEELPLDVLVIDTHPGLNEETLLSMAVADAVAIVMRPDQQDYQGTAVTVDVARKLDVPRLLVVVNAVPSVFDRDEVKARVETAYGCEVAAVLPHSEEMMALGSGGLFVLRYPGHLLSEELERLANRLIR